MLYLRLTLVLTAFFIMLFGLAYRAMAKDFPITDQDQANILLICEMAAKSPSINIEMTANVAQFCIAWKKRMADSSKEEPKGKE